MSSKILAVLLILLPAGVYAGLVGVPELSRPVTDLTGTLTPEQTVALEAKITAFEQRKGSQIAVLMVPTTQPEDIAEYGIKVADYWQIGRQKTDDGVILIIAKDDRKLRLEVGYGLEGVIPDAIAKRIISETITPFFRNNDYAGGIAAGIDQLIHLIDGEPLPSPTMGVKPKPVHVNPEGKLMMIVFIGLLVGAILAAIFGRTAGGLLAGIGSATVVTFLLGFGIAAIIVGLIVFFMIGVRQRGGTYWTNGGGFGGGFGGGSSSGSWGGGGGRFGGGGASGSW